MKEHKNIYPTTMMAKLLKVSVSRFYDWLKPCLSQRKIQSNQQTILVKIAHQKTNESYGHIRLTKYLQSQGIQISAYAVRCIKRLNQLYCKRHKRFKRTTNSDHNRAVYNNLLEQNFIVTILMGLMTPSNAIRSSQSDKCMRCFHQEKCETLERYKDQLARAK